MAMGEWECSRCGYIASDDGPPDVCPECGAVTQKFVYFAYPDAGAWEEEDLYIGLDVAENGVETVMSGDLARPK
jgi:rubredoxin